MFLAIWLSAFSLTSSSLIHQVYAGGPYTSQLLKLGAIEIGVFTVWAIYWMILYPRYFTPFRDIATPKVNITLLIQSVDVVLR